MQVSLKWINELVNIETINLNSLIEKLTLGGFEVEEILAVEINNEKQISLDISATANRSDSLSIQGIANEVAVLTNQPIKLSNYSQKPQSWKREVENTQLTLSNPSDCSKFVSVIIENLNNLNVPKWVTNKLVSSGLKTTNNLLDFQQYILLETGYPFAFYDFDKIQSKVNDTNFKLSISKARENQSFMGTNSINYKLNDSILLVNINDHPISIAGIIEHEDFAYSEKTTSLLIEGSIFNAAKIRQQSRSLGLRTDRSARYEKSLKNTYLIEALYRLVTLLRISNPNLVCKLHTNLQTLEEAVKPILLRYEKLKEVLGPLEENNEYKQGYLEPNLINNYLERLDFSFFYDPKKLTWDVQVPHSRTDDITREIDLIEEIGRLHGFNKFLTTLPKIQRIGKEDISYTTRKKLTTCLLNLGFTELIHYSLVPPQSDTNKEIKLVNPSVSEYSSLRTSLLPNLIKTVHENLKQGNGFIDGFEYGHVFLKNSLGKFNEKEYIGGIFGGNKRKLTWSSNETILTWFEAKGKIEQLFEQLNLAVKWQNSKSIYANDLIHPYCSAELYSLNGDKIGLFGQIHPIFANKLNLPSEIYLFEFNIEIIQLEIQKNKLTIYKEYFTYPKVIKDLSFIVQRNIPFSKLQEVLYLNGSQFLSKINLLDEYRGESIPADQTSLCLQLIFQSNKETLQNKKIENIIEHLQKVLIDNFKATIRK